MVDLDKVTVITGFAEVGPWRSSRMRWEMEAIGEFTIEGCIEMAWKMGYIKHFDGCLKDGLDVRGRYEKSILAHTGVHLIGEPLFSMTCLLCAYACFAEPELFRGYNPNKKVFNQEVEFIHNLEPIKVTEAEAEKFKYEHGDKCDVWAGEGDQWFFNFKKGARIFVPKALGMCRILVADNPIFF
jgi:fatty acid synthase subunit beta